MNTATRIVTIVMLVGLVASGALWRRRLDQNEHRWTNESVASLRGIGAGWATFMFAGGLLGGALGRSRWAVAVVYAALAALIFWNLQIQYRTYLRRVRVAMLTERAGPPEPPHVPEIEAELVSAPDIPGRIPMMVRRRTGQLERIRCVETSMPGLYVAFDAASRDPFEIQAHDELRFRISHPGDIPRVIVAVHPSVRLHP